MSARAGEIKFKCPACEREIVGGWDLANATVRCVNCQHEFKPSDPEAEMQFIGPAPESRKAAEALAKRVKNIQANARVMVVGAVVAFLIAILCFLGDQLAAGAGCVGVALWLYLIAQVIHIRANTER